MIFREKAVEDFIRVFEDAKPRIEALDGCEGVELLRDKNAPAVLMTYSVWKDEDALEEYRRSELFKTTWSKTKLFFDGKPEAWSLDKIN